MKRLRSPVIEPTRVSMPSETTSARFGMNRSGAVCM